VCSLFRSTIAVALPQTLTEPVTVTADIMALRGGVPIRANGEVVGAVGVAGLSNDTNTEIANTAAAALSPH
jgi:uncharacterized protein GlcG (DUF336 family)